MFSALAKTSAQVCQAARMETTSTAPASTWITSADLRMLTLPTLRLPYCHQLPRRPRPAARLTAARSACRAGEGELGYQRYIVYAIVVSPPKGLTGPLYWGKLKGHNGTEDLSTLQDLPSSEGWNAPLVMELLSKAVPLCLVCHVTAQGRTDGPVGIPTPLAPLLMFRSVATMAFTINLLSFPLSLESLIRMGAHPAIRPRRRLLDADGNGRELGTSRVPLPAPRRTPTRGMRSRTSVPPTATSRAGLCRG